MQTTTPIELKIENTYLEFDLTIEFDYHYQAGVYTALPEDCYPEEEDMEINALWLDGVAGFDDLLYTQIGESVIQEIAYEALRDHSSEPDYDVLIELAYEQQQYS